MATPDGRQRQVCPGGRARRDDAGGHSGRDADFALWQFSNKGQGDDRTLDSDFTEDRDTGQAAWGALSDYVDVTNGAEFDLDGGIHPREDAEAKTADVRGQVWNDKNRNGIQDAGEPALANVPVFVFPNDEEEDETELRNQAKGLTDKDGLTRNAAKASAPAGDDPEVLVLTGADGRYEVKGIKLNATGEIVVLVFPFTVDANGDFDEIWKVTKPHQGNDASKDSDVFPTKLDDPELPDVLEYGTVVFPAVPAPRRPSMPACTAMNRRLRVTAAARCRRPASRLAGSFWSVWRSSAAVPL